MTAILAKAGASLTTSAGACEVTRLAEDEREGFCHGKSRERPAGDATLCLRS